MTALRQKMVEDMQLKGLALRTQEAYVNAVLQLSRRFKKAPDSLDEEDLRDYFLYLKNEKQVAESTFSIALCGIKFFSRRTSGRCMSRRWEKNGIPCNLSVQTEKRNFQLFLAQLR